MPVIEISDSLFARLQKLAVPLVDTPVTVIERLLGSFEAPKGKPARPRDSQSHTRCKSRRLSANLNPERSPASGTPGS